MNTSETETDSKRVILWWRILQLALFTVFRFDPSRNKTYVLYTHFEACRRGYLYGTTKRMLVVKLQRI